MDENFRVMKHYSAVSSDKIDTHTCCEETPAERDGCGLRSIHT